jgi:hypothetical protein
MAVRKLPHVDDLPNAIKAWLKKRKLDYDVFFFSASAWQDRGEKYGKGSLFTMTAEGTLNHILNYPETKADVRIAEAFLKFLEKLGIYYVQGYAWSFHFYTR